MRQPRGVGEPREQRNEVLQLCVGCQQAKPFIFYIYIYIDLYIYIYTGVCFVFLTREPSARRESNDQVVQVCACCQEVNLKVTHQ